jgi:hypothetical protein
MKKHLEDVRNEEAMKGNTTTFALNKMQLTITDKETGEVKVLPVDLNCGGLTVEL